MNLFLDVFSRAPRFIVVGLGATALHFLVLVALVEIVRVPWPTFASAVGAIAGIATAYYGNYGWTFARTESHSSFLAHFVGLYVLTMGVNTALVYIQINHLQINYAVSCLVATSFSTTLNFLLCKFAVFERKGFVPLSSGKNYQ